jgi:hypothetical protein
VRKGAAEYALAESSVHSFTHRHSAIFSSLPLHPHRPSHVSAFLLLCCPESVVQVARVGQRAGFHRAKRVCDLSVVSRGM